MTMSSHIRAILRALASHTSHHFFHITHSSFALIGLAVVFLVLALVVRPDLRSLGEERVFHWLHTRQIATTGLPLEPAASQRATAGNPQALPREQAAVTYWLSRKYRIAPEPLAVLVAEAYDLGQRTRLDPTLILAVMAIESRFNPFAQSPVGAQGLMQVMTNVHTEKYDNFGGHFAAFDPVTNLRVGVRVLQECIQRAGSLEDGLRYYVGAANLPSDGGYAAKVLAEHFRLRQVAANGRSKAPPLLSAEARVPDMASTKRQNIALLSDI